MNKTLLVLALFSTTTLAADPVLLSAVSRKTHGAAGTFDIALSETVDTIEPRSGWNKIVFTFDKAIFGAECYVTEGNVTLQWAFVNGNQAICIYYDAPTGWAGIQTVVEAYDGTLGEATVRIGHLLGDINGSGAVTVSDLARVRPMIAQPVTQQTFRYDVNANGAITVADMAIVQSRIATGLPRD